MEIEIEIETEESTITSMFTHRSDEEGTEGLPCELVMLKRCFCNPADCLQQKLDISAVSMFGKTHIIFRKTSCSLKIIA